MRKTLIVISASLALLFSAQVFCLISNMRALQDEVKAQIEQNDSVSQEMETVDGFFQIRVRGKSVASTGAVLEVEKSRSVVLWWTWEPETEEL